MRGIALPLALMASQAAAQDCVTAWEYVQSGELGYDVRGVLAVNGQTCTITDLRIESQSEFGTNFLIDRLVLGGSGIGDARVGMPLGPMDFDLAIDGLRTFPVVPDTTMQFLFEAQAFALDGISARMVMAFDPASGRLDLPVFTADFGGMGRVTGQMQVTGLTAAVIEDPESGIEALAIPQARLVITTTGLFESFALIPLGVQYLSGPDPALALEAFQAEAIAGLQSLSPGLIDAASLAALTALTSALPNPRGELLVDLAVDPGAVDALVMVAKLGPVPDGVTLSVTWTPIPKGAQP